MDLTAAYTTVNHILLLKLARMTHHVGIMRIILSNWTFFIELDGRWRKQRNSLPQGSVLARTPTISQNLTKPGYLFIRMNCVLPHSQMTSRRLRNWLNAVLEMLTGRTHWMRTQPTLKCVSHSTITIIRQTANSKSNGMGRNCKMKAFISGKPIVGILYMGTSLQKVD